MNLVYLRHFTEIQNYIHHVAFNVSKNIRLTDRHQKLFSLHSEPQPDVLENVFRLTHWDSAWCFGNNLRENKLYINNTLGRQAPKTFVSLQLSSTSLRDVSEKKICISHWA